MANHSQGGHSPANVAHYPGGIDFPASKDDLVRHARSHDADDDVLEVLRQMSQRDYGSMADVMKGVGRVE
jgi:hypothetical protein